MNKLLHFFLICLITSALTSQENKNIVVLGSSTAAGFAIDPIDSSWVNLFADSLSELNSNLRLINLSQFGFSTYDILPSSYNGVPANRPNADIQRNITTALSYNPIAIIINLPSNGAAYDYSVEEQIANYEILFKTVKEKNIPLWICSPQPRSDFNSVQMNTQLTLKDYMFSMCGDLLIDFWSGIATEKGNIQPQFNLGDDIHLNKRGHNEIFKRAASKIFPYLAEKDFFKNNDKTNFSKTLIDDFENIVHWKVICSDASDMTIKSAPGVNGNAINLNYNFPKGTGYCGIQRELELDLNKNFKFTFFLKAESPNNNFEFKLLDKSGENVWWKNKWDYDFPDEWKKITIKKRDIEFAWGPAINNELNRIAKLEFTIASSSGGSGSVFIDSLMFTYLSDDLSEIFKPEVSLKNIHTSSSLDLVIDGSTEREIELNCKPGSHLKFNFKKLTELGGTAIYWGETHIPGYKIFGSADNKTFELIYETKNSNGGIDFIPFGSIDIQYLKIQFEVRTDVEKYFVKEIRFLPLSFSDDPNEMFMEIADNYPRGSFPRYTYNEGTYYNVSGVERDSKEGLINEEGMVEVDKKQFSIEPFIFYNEKLLTWNESENQQSLEDSYLPIPFVTRKYEDIELGVEIFSAGEADKSSELIVNYFLKNTSSQKIVFDFYLAIRPFQVYPNYMQLFFSGGTSRIHKIKQNGSAIEVDDKKIFLLNKPNDFGAVNLMNDEIVAYLIQNKLPSNKEIVDDYNYASGAIKYSVSLEPGEIKQYSIVVPFHQNYSNLSNYSVDEINDLKNDVAEKWEESLSNIKINLPSSEKRLIDILKSNIAYILINADGPGTQPGSRCYERSWIRDGAFTIAALMKFEYLEEAKKYIEWYSDFQFESGKIPCIVDTRGPEPVDEHDSNGEYLFLLKTYFDFAKDTTLIKQHFNNISAAVDWLRFLIEQRKTSKYTENESISAYYGILPESISHEGYSPPRHSYWDSFFAYRGLIDAVALAEIAGEKEYAAEFKKLFEEFQKNLIHSINQAAKNENVSYIPGCVELGDFDATSTAISVYPTFAYRYLPETLFQNTFDRYTTFFHNRRNDEIWWKDYTPYEVRLITTFIMLKQPDKARDMLDFFLDDIRPQGWNHWAEVVHKGYRANKYIGDMPHTWVGSEYINAIRTMFVYEDFSDTTLYIGAGIDPAWFTEQDEISFSDLHTSFGKISYSVENSSNKIIYNFDAEIDAPQNGILIRNLFPEKKCNTVVDGERGTLHNDYLKLFNMPEEIVFEY